MVGGVAFALLVFGCFEFLDTLTVSRSDTALLDSKQPLLVGRAVAHILRGSMNRAVFAGLVAALALLFLWMVAASLGRIATVRALLDYFRSGAEPSGLSELPNRVPAFGSLFTLNFLRATAALAGFLALVGAATLVGHASPEKSPRPGLPFILFLPLAALIGMAWLALNWLLSLAGLFVVRNTEDAADALFAAVVFVRERTSAFAAVSSCTWLAHVIAFCVATGAVSIPLALVHIAPRLMIAVIVLITLAYFALVDWLSIARLAGYICITEMPDALTSPTAAPVPPPSDQIDRDELILGDIPAQA